ncbi:Tetrapyrrole (Corrin/Porphyrin) Methylases [Thermoanaerobacterium sp. RBIITD]|nr:SAM-dependent methyltransferase [Thermoanaerobacterium sp. RBIITD]SNX55192.1 Tetrapyrrole (Corrin/Porphyrin) Methylases [Thermoanaerobacterium sp. RBIITD]
MPESENLKSLAKHHATMAIFLSVHKIDKLVKDLITEYNEDTPVAVVYKATWDDKIIINDKLKDIDNKVKEKI